MGFLIFVLITTVLLAALAGAGAFLVYELSKQDMFFTTVETGGFKFTVKGEAVFEVLDNLEDGDYYNTQLSMVVNKNDHPKIEGENCRRINFLEQKTGIIWLGFYPFIKIHQFEVVADTMKTQEEIVQNNLPVEQRINYSIKKVSYLRSKFPHPEVTPNAELGKDNWQVTILMWLDIQIIDPIKVVFRYKGKIASQVDASVNAVVIQFCAQDDMDYDKFLAEETGPESPFVSSILKLNHHVMKNDVEVWPGLAGMYGVKLCAAHLEERELSPEQEKLREASTERDRQLLLAEASEHEARKISALAKAPKEGIGAGYAAMIQSLKDSGLSTEVAAAIVNNETVYGNIAKSPTLTTYVEGGGKARIMIPVKEGQKGS